MGTFVEKNGYKLEDVDRLFNEKIEKLKDKKSIREKRPLGGYTKTDAGKFVDLKDTNYPIKRFILQEMNEGKYLRIGYYVLSLKKLKKEGKLKIVWGQSNPSFLKEDLLMLLEKARKNEIIK